MLKQTEINFHHGHENLRENEDHYEANIERFSGHCKAILERLLNGERLTTINGREYGTGDLRARIRDIRKHVKVEGDFIKTGGRTGYKIYYMNNEEIQRVKSLYRI